jgi:hypothetical protein
VGSHADVMVSPQHVNRIKFTLLGKNLRFTTMIDNVGELIRLEKVILIKVVHTYSVERGWSERAFEITRLLSKFSSVTH